MPYGFYARNDAGTIQIDDQFKNLALASKGVGSTTTSSDSAGSFLTISHVGSTPLIFWQCAVGAVVSSQSSGGTTTWTLYCATAASQVITWFIFDAPEVIPETERYGLKVRNSLGQTTFHSQHRYMKVVDSLVVPVGVVGTEYNYGGGNYAVALGMRVQGGRVLRPSMGTGTGLVGNATNMIRQSSTGFVISDGLTKVFAGDGASAFNMNTQNHVMLIDVAGF